MVVQHNLSAMNACRMYGLTSTTQAKTTERLSSGYKINRAADDAANLAISEKLRRQVRGLTQASANAQDGISLVQIADGAMAEIHEMLNRGTELSVKAANGTLSDNDRKYLQEEIDQLCEEISEIRQKTTFNEIPVLKGGNEVNDSGAFITKGGLPDWVGGDFATGHFTGADASDHAASAVDFSSLNAGNVGDLVGNGFHVSCATCTNQYSIKFVSGESDSVEASGSHFIYKVNVDGVSDGDTLVSRIVSVTGGQPQGHYTHFTNNGSGILGLYDDRTPASQYQVGSTIGKGVAEAVPLDADAVDELKLQVGSEAGQYITLNLPAMSLQKLGLNPVLVTTQPNAANAIDQFKGAMEWVSHERSRMGSYQNRLEHTINNLNNVVENTQSAESQIRDADMAKEMVSFSNNNIMQQAGASMLAQANQSREMVLSLLQ